MNVNQSIIEDLPAGILQNIAERLQGKRGGWKIIGDISQVSTKAQKACKEFKKMLSTYAMVFNFQELKELGVKFHKNGIRKSHLTFRSSITPEEIYTFWRQIPKVVESIHILNANGRFDYQVAQQILDTICIDPELSEIEKKELILKFIRGNGYLLGVLDSSYRMDIDIVREAINECPEALKFADKTLKKNPKIVLQAVKLNGLVLRSADPLLKADKRVVMAAVSECGTALMYADPLFQGDRDIVLAAVKQNGRALHLVDLKLRSDREIVLAAMMQDVGALYFADERFASDKELALIAVTRDVCALCHFSDDIRADKEVVLAAVRYDKRAIKYADKKLHSDFDVLKAIHGNDKNSLIFFV